MGAGGSLQRFSVRYRDMDVPGDTLTCKGTVVEQDSAAGTVLCKLEMVNGKGQTTTTGEAVVALPQR
jgi:acyl dehydratase